jgi:hypothetical protein
MQRKGTKFGASEYYREGGSDKGDELTTSRRKSSNFYLRLQQKNPIYSDFINYILRVLLKLVYPILVEIYDNKNWNITRRSEFVFAS